jgi:phospholipid-binding lipoprotein MlaA
MATKRRNVEKKIVRWVSVLSALGLTVFLSPCFAQNLTPFLLGETSLSILDPPDETLRSSAVKESSESSTLEESESTIRDPVEPVNRIFFEVNDKLYFWFFKPVAIGYKAIIPEQGRIGVRNFFSNLNTPVRLANCLLQAKFKSAGNEVARFFLNSTAGLAGFLDLAKRDFNVEKEDRDFGQTLGVWGLGPAFYIDWPILGPSNVRDTLGYVGDLFFDPRTYLLTRPIFYVARPVELVNDTSLKIGEYESLKKAALDPYIALREAYTQYRQNKIGVR